MATAAHADRDLTLFRVLDRVFWLVWLGLPVMVWAAVSSLSDATVLSQLPADKANCATLLPRPDRMSAAGQAIFWGLFAFQISIYLILLAYLHIMVHRFATGRIFVAETLSSLQWLGMILIVWPFLEKAANHVALSTLRRLGDIEFAVESTAIDVAPVAVGLFLVALRHVLERAITLKSENDLTV